MRDLGVSLATASGPHGSSISASAAILQVPVAFGHCYGHPREYTYSVERPLDLHGDNDGVWVPVPWLLVTHA